MSKEAALRAMREARYGRQAARTTPAAPRLRPPVAPPAGAAPAATAGAGDAADGLCGHRSMNGRTCTREHGHAAKSHRYN